MNNYIKSLLSLSLSIFLVATFSVFANTENSFAQEKSLGVVDFPNSCSPSVKDDLNKSIALLHHMM